MSGISMSLPTPATTGFKLLYADGTGIWVCAKTLVRRGTFAWPKSTEPGALQILAAELNPVAQRH